jgi:hypothetical protein
MAETFPAVEAKAQRRSLERLNPFAAVNFSFFASLLLCFFASLLLCAFAGNPLSLTRELL